MATNPSIEFTNLQAFADLCKTVGVPTMALFWVLFRTDKRLDRIIELMGGKKENDSK